MSTKSTIALQIEPNKYKSIYCHHANYPSVDGDTLVKYYNTREKVEKLIELGSICYLAPKVDFDQSKPHNMDNHQMDVCLAFHRDGGEKECEINNSDFTGIFEESYIDYTYIFTLEDKWIYYSCMDDLPSYLHESLELDEKMANYEKMQKHSNSDEEM